MDIQILTEEAIELLCRLIETPRVSRQEAAAADMLQAFMSERGLSVQRLGNNLWTLAPDYNPTRPTLLLAAHIDTVRPTDGWTLDPHKAERREGCIYGLGSNDDGASLVSLLQVFRLLSQRTDRSYNLIFVASAEEELGGHNGIESVLPQLPPVTLGLVGEPTGMQPAIAEKGLMVLDVTCHGRSGHAARDEGDNAIYHAIDEMQWFRTHQWPRVSPLLGRVKMTVTIVNAGTQHNVVPDRCTFTVDVRSNELYTNEELFEAIRLHSQADVVARSFRIGSSSIPVNHPLVVRAIHLGRTPFGSPTLSDQALMHFPSMKMGPGQSSRSHTANEFVREDEIRQAIPLYFDLLDGLAIE